LRNISKGDAGAWAISTDFKVLKFHPQKKRWLRIRFEGKMAIISSGKSVWGVNRKGEIYKHMGRNKWRRIKGALRIVDVSNKDRVWGVNKHQNIYRRTGDKWQKLEGKLVQVSVGESGVWGVNRHQNIYYRKGTYGDVDTAGSDWIKVPGKLRWVSSGSDLVVGCNGKGEVYYRKGITSRNPTGTNWVRVRRGKMAVVDVDGNEVRGVAPRAKEIYKFRIVNLLKSKL